MNQMPSLSVGNMIYSSQNLSFLVFDDCFNIIQEDGLLTFHLSNVREINQSIYRYLDHLIQKSSNHSTSFPQFVLIFSIFPFLKNELSSFTSSSSSSSSSMSPPIVSFPISFIDEMESLEKDTITITDRNELFSKLFQLKQQNIQNQSLFITYNNSSLYHCQTKIIPFPSKQWNPDISYEKDMFLQQLSLQQLFSSKDNYLTRPWLKYVQKKFISFHSKKLQQQQQQESLQGEYQLQRGDEEYQSLLQPSSLLISSSIYQIFFKLQNDSSTIFDMKPLNIHEEFQQKGPQLSFLGGAGKGGNLEVINIMILKVTDTTAQILVEGNYNGLLTIECIDSLTGIIFQLQQVMIAHSPRMFQFYNLIPSHHYTILSSSSSSSQRSSSLLSSSAYVGSFSTNKRPHYIENDETGRKRIVLPDPSSSSSSEGNNNHEYILIVGNILNRTNLGFYEGLLTLIQHPLTEIKLMIHSIGSFDWTNGIISAIEYYQIAENYSKGNNRKQEEINLLKGKEILSISFKMNIWLNYLMKSIFSSNSHYFMKCAIIEILLSLGYYKLSSLFLDYSSYVISHLITEIQYLLDLYLDWNQTVASLSSSVSSSASSTLSPNFDFRRRHSPSAIPSRFLGNDILNISASKGAKVSFISSSSLLLFEITPLLSEEWNSIDELLITKQDIQLLYDLLFSSSSYQEIAKIIILSPIPLLLSPNQLFKEEKLCYNLRYRLESCLSLLSICGDWLCEGEEATQELNNEEQGEKIRNNREVVIVSGLDQGCMLSDILVEKMISTVVSSVPAASKQRLPVSLHSSPLINPASRGFARLEEGNLNSGEEGFSSPSPTRQQQQQQYHQGEGKRRVEKIMSSKIIKQLSCGAKEGKSLLLNNQQYQFYWKTLSSHQKFSSSSSSAASTSYRISVLPPNIQQLEELQELEETSNIYSEYGIISFSPVIHSLPTSLMMKNNQKLIVDASSLQQNSITSLNSSLGGGVGGHPFSGSLSQHNNVSPFLITSNQLNDFLPDWKYLLDEGKALLPFKPSNPLQLIKKHLYYLYQVLLLSPSLENTIFSQLFATFSNKEDLSNIPIVIQMIIEEETLALDRTFTYLQQTSSFLLHGHIPIINIRSLSNIFHYYLSYFIGIGIKIVKLPSILILQLLEYHLYSSATVGVSKRGKTDGSAITEEEDHKKKVEMLLGRELLTKKEKLKELITLGLLLQLMSEELSRETLY
jgi:hypothetical protein